MTIYFFSFFIYSDTIEYSDTIKYSDIIVLDIQDPRPEKKTRLLQRAIEVKKLMQQENLKKSVNTQNRSTKKLNPFLFLIFPAPLWDLRPSFSHQSHLWTSDIDWGQLTVNQKIHSDSLFHYQVSFLVLYIRKWIETSALSCFTDN